jgi:hypothetical protein
MPNSKALSSEVSPRTGQVDKRGSFSWDHGDREGGARQEDAQRVIQGQGGPGHPTLPLTETKSLLKFLELNPNV